MVMVGAVFCVAMAWGIGANDIANFFGPAIGARSISLKHGMLLAFIFEFIGAFFLGSTVAKTIRKSIVNFEAFDGEADLLLLGMFSSLTAASLWVYLATRYALPVSTTQSIVGAIVGFSLVAKGRDAVDWDALTSIIIFWVGTPLLGCLACIILWTPTRHFILNQQESSYRVALRAYPLFVFLVIGMMSTFLLFKGFKRVDELGDWTEANPGWVVLIGIGCGVVAALCAYLGLVRTGIVARYAEREDTHKTNKTNNTSNDIDSANPTYPTHPQHIASASSIEMPTADGQDTTTIAGSQESVTVDVDFAGKTETVDHESHDQLKNTKMTKPEQAGQQHPDNKLVAMGNKLKTGLNVDIFDDLTKEEQDVQKHSVQFEARTERLFEWLSVLAAVFATFAHGSNDIANAIAPFSAIVSLSGQNPGDDISEKNEVQLWVLLMGSFAMSVGCVTYGYNVIKTMGVKLAKLSPSRGYFTQVAAALVIIFGSNYGFPASTTHCQVGATVGLGLIEKAYNKNVRWNQVFNWRLLGIVFFGWIGTILIAGGTSALIYSAMAYSPCA